eukprot:5687404-Pyramimonas_sp.AAC.1
MPDLKAPMPVRRVGPRRRPPQPRRRCGPSSSLAGAAKVPQAAQWEVVDETYTLTDKAQQHRHVGTNELACGA